MEPQEKLIDNYRIFILNAVNILKRFPEFIASSAEKEKSTRDKPDDFKKETLALLACLEDLYADIDIDAETLTIEGTTKKISIAYYDKNRGYKGVKKGGRYSISIALSKITQACSNPTTDCISAKRPLKKYQKISQQNITANPLSSPEKHIHPHINTTSGVCWGSMRNHILFLMRNFQFLEVLLCSYEFLSHANLESCYNKDEFLQWKEVEQ